MSEEKSMTATRVPNYSESYIAWLNGTSVARGTMSEVREKAFLIYKSRSWQQTVTARGKETTLRITKGARQSFASSEVLG